MIVSYYRIFQQKSILWLRCMYYSDESSRVKQGRGGERAGCTKYALKQTCVKALSNSLKQKTAYITCFLAIYTQTEQRIFRMAFLLMARISVRSAMRALIPLFYEQSPFCSSFSLELYIYEFISYTLLYIEETEVISLHNRGFFW